MDDVKIEVDKALLNVTLSAQLCSLARKALRKSK